jgi:hypothetical protein
MNLEKPSESLYEILEHIVNQKIDNFTNNKNALT